jgi:perosamine synthetase
MNQECSFKSNDSGWPRPEVFRFRVSQPSVSQHEIDMVTKSLAEGWISHVGPYNELLERELSNYLGIESLVVSNGSVAIMLALRGLGIGHGDEVIVPTLTYAATASAVVNVGARPIFVDVDENSWQISLNAITKVQSPRAKAIIVPHVYGVCSHELQEIRDFADSRGLYLIEDVAEALGGEFREKKLGTIGHVSTFSFFANKLITTGEGGAVATNSESLRLQMKLLRGQGMSPRNMYWFVEPGFNFRLSGIQAAFGLAQLSRLNELMDKRREIEEAYSNMLSGIITRPSSSIQAIRAPWLFSGVIESQSVCSFCLAQELAMIGIESRPIFYPLNSQPAFSRYSSEEILIAPKLARSGITLPTSSIMQVEEAWEISTAIKEIIFNREERKIVCQR